jgi:hypothetical protein
MVSLAIFAFARSAQGQSHWGVVNLDAESTTMFAGALALENQSNWAYYNGADAPGGAYMGSVDQAQTLTGIIQLPRALTPGRYNVFFNGYSYDSNETIQAVAGGATSTGVVADDRDDNRLWTNRAVLDVVSTAATLQILITRNPAVAGNQKYLFMGMYITTADETVDRYATAIKLVYPTAMSSGTPVKGNVVTDSGFETGIGAAWGFDGKRAQSPIWDTTEAFEGNASMKISLDHSANAYGDNMSLYSRVYHLKSNTKYTLSMYVKTSPGRTVPLLLQLVNTFTPPAGFPPQPAFAAGLLVNDSWQRISVTGFALDYPTPDYQIYVFSNELAGGYLWIDGFQLEEGDLTAYQPSSTVAAGVVINNQPGNVFYSDELITGNLIARNTSAAPATAVFRYEIYDSTNSLVQQGAQNLSLPAQTTQQRPLNLGTGKLGIFRIVSWIDGMENTNKELVYSVMSRPPLSGVDANSYLGMHLEFTDAQLAIMQKIGMKWARAQSPSGYFLWNYAEPADNVFNFYDSDLQRGTTYGITTMGTLGTNNFWPLWAQDPGGLPNLDKWQEFVGQISAHYKDVVTSWEVWNEPHSVFSASFYAQMLKRASDAIEASSPGSKIVGMGGVPLSYMQAVISQLLVLYPAWDWKQHVTILSTHAYPDGQPPESFIGPIINAYGVGVWNTEAGVWDRGFYEGPESNFAAWGKSLWQYQDASRYYLGMLGAPNLLVQNFGRTIASGMTKYFYYDARTYVSPDYARTHTSTIEYDGSVRSKGIAYAIAGSLIDHSVGLGNGSLDPNSFFLVFDKAGGAVAMLFTSDKKPRQVTLALSPSQFQVLDLMGNPITIAGATVPYGRFPVYIRGNAGLSGTALKAALLAGVVATRLDTTPPNVSISDGPRGPVAGSAFRVRWIGLDDTSYPTNGEVNPGASSVGEPPNPEALLYSYRLDPYSNWSSWTGRSFADFSNIATGTYTFSVKARDEAGNESGVASRTIVVGITNPTSVPQLLIVKSHVGNFTQGQVGASYALTVSNLGTAPTTGTVTVTESAPAGLTIMEMSGTGWVCGASSCTRSDDLAVGASYPTITVTVNVVADAGSSVTNSATVSGGGSTSNTANDQTTINPASSGPQLSITKVHPLSFKQGQIGAFYILTVSNVGSAPTNGTVTVAESAPAGLTITEMSGTGWACVSTSCTRSDALAGGATYPTITVTVDVTANAPSSLTNSATVSGGGSTSSTANDPTTIIPSNSTPGPRLSILKSHVGNFTQGQVGASYILTVSNLGTGPTTETVIVTESAPAALTITEMSGTGWACGATSCTRSDELAVGASYPTIAVTVNVVANAGSSVTNSATVSGGGSTSNTANDQTTINPASSGPQLSITKVHPLSFKQGQIGAFYILTVSNVGSAPTNGTVTVAESAPAGLTITEMSGTGWACVSTSCTRSDALAGAATYPTITVTVDVTANAPSSLTNSATVSGGGSSSSTATDPTTIIPSNSTPGPQLSILKSHVGNFTQGQVGASYVLTVSNLGTAPTTGTVTVTESAPAGLTITEMSGTGWACEVTSCTRSDALAVSESYRTITVTVNVAANAASSVTNSATVTGGGSSSNTANDPTTINPSD